MSNVVVDTDIVSYLFKSHSIAFQYLPDLANQTPLISFMTVAELERWVLHARWGDARRKRLYEYLKPFAVFPYDRALCTKWAEVMVAAQSRGRRVECADGWIAATALLYDTPLLTHNLQRLRGSSRLKVDFARTISLPSAHSMQLRCRLGFRPPQHA